MGRKPKKVQAADLVKAFDEDEERADHEELMSTEPEISRKYNSVWSNTDKVLSKIPIDKLRPSAQDFQINDKEVELLSLSIKKVGLLQPLLVRKIKEGRKDAYQIISGHKRYYACKLVNYTDVECIVTQVTEDQVQMIIDFANIQRDRPNALEIAAVYRTLSKQTDAEGKFFDVKTIAEMYHVSLKTVYRVQHIFDLIPELQQLITANCISIVGVEPIYNSMNADQQKILADHLNSLPLSKRRITQKAIDRVVKLAEVTPDFTPEMLEAALKPDQRQKFKNRIYNIIDMETPIDMTEAEMDALVAELLRDYFDELNKDSDEDGEED